MSSVPNPLSVFAFVGVGTGADLKDVAIVCELCVLATVAVVAVALVRSSSARKDVYTLSGSTGYHSITLKLFSAE